MSGIAMGLYFSWPTFKGPSLSPENTGMIDISVTLLCIPILCLFVLSFFGVPVGLIALIIKRNRPFLILTLFMLLMTISCTIGLRAGWKIRYNNFNLLTMRFKPLIDAIERFHEEKDRYPETLGELTPAYIESLPSTGMIGYGNYDYHLSGRESPYKNYEISLSCGNFFASDLFIYWHDDDYPEELYGGNVKKMDKWAYVHDHHKD
jgi:hypothetical protein